jgi:hypothetical protein
MIGPLEVLKMLRVFGIFVFSVRFVGGWLGGLSGCFNA